MSSSRGSGIKRHRLVLLAFDFSSEGNEIVLSECVDAWGEFELLDEVYLVDLSVVDGASFSCVEPGQTETFLLEKILSDKIWSDITVISVRLAPLSRVEIRRVSQEEGLQLAVERVFPDGAACKTSFSQCLGRTTKIFMRTHYLGATRAIFCTTEASTPAQNLHERHLTKRVGIFRLFLPR